MYTYNRRRALLIVVAAAWLLACLPAGLAGPVPGDPNPVQTTGMCFATYGFTVNTTTYSNVTLDVRSMSDSVSTCDEAGFTNAYAVWKNGQYSYRNLVTNAKRIAKDAVERDYTGEDWYEAAKSYFPEGRYYLGSVIEEALNGTGRFQGACTGVRAETVKAGMLFYPILYFYHEIDAAIKTMRGIAAGTAPAAARDPLYSGLVEAQDAWACYFCPNVATAKPKEFIAAGSTSSSYRVAPEYNPWDVQAALDRYFSCSNSYAAGQDSSINKDLLRLNKDIYNYIARGLGQPAAQPVDQVHHEVTILRRQAEQLLNLRQVQLTVRAVYQACTNSGFLKSCNDCSRGKKLWAAAWTHWRMAEPTLQNTNFAPGNTPIDRTRLSGVRDMLAPDRVGNRPTKDQCKAVYEAIQGIMSDFKYPTGYSWETVIGRCKRL